MAIQVHVPLGQTAGSGSIWHKYRAQVLRYFLALRLWRVGSEARVIAISHVLVCTLKFQVSILQQPEPRWGRKAERKGRARPCLQPNRAPAAPRRALSPRPPRPRPTNNAPARAALTTQVSAPSAPARLDLAMAAPLAQARGCSRSGAAGPAARTDRCAPHSLAAPHRGPEPPRRPRRPPPSNSSAAPGPRARPKTRKD